MDLAHLGVGYVLYFKLIIFFCLLMLVFLVINILKVVANVSQNNCVPPSDAYIGMSAAGKYYFGKGYPVCKLDWITIHSVANYGIQNLDISEKACVFTFFIVYWSILALCQRYIKRTNYEIDQHNDTPSDWTIIVKGLTTVETSQDIKDFFEKNGLKAGFCKVKKINMAYDCTKYKEWKKKNNEAKSDQFTQKQVGSRSAGIQTRFLQARSGKLPRDGLCHLFNQENC